LASSILVSATVTTASLARFAPACRTTARYFPDGSFSIDTAENVPQLVNHHRRDNPLNW
jgi:hypothetical protein